MSEDWLVERMMFLVPLLLSLTVHEWAHAWSARVLGDDTAEREGRLTLNPVAHIDPIGSVLLPLLGVPFGWAKPVPVNMGRFHPSVSPRTGVLLTAGAGPASNLILAMGCVLVLVAASWGYGNVDAVPQGLSHLMRTMIFLNTILAVFNLLPIPPLDGSRIVDSLLPDAFRPAWDGFCRIGTFGLMLILMTAMIAFPDVFGWPLQAVDDSLAWLFGNEFSRS